MLIEWPLLGRDIGVVLALAFCFSLGDLGIISLFGSPDFVTHLPENFQNFFFTTLCKSRVNKPPMVAVHLSGKYRARLVSIAADRNYCFNLLVKELG